MTRLRFSITKSILVFGFFFTFSPTPALACDYSALLGSVAGALGALLPSGILAQDVKTEAAAASQALSALAQLKLMVQTTCPINSINAPGVKNDVNRIHQIYLAFEKARQQLGQPIVDDGFAESQIYQMDQDGQDLNTLINLVENNSSSTAIMQIQAKLQGELIAQLRGMRAFELARLRQDQIDHQAAIDDYAMPAKPPSEYTGQ